MAEALTIDNYGVNIHERYALDQEVLDTQFTKDSHLIPAHSEVAARETAITTKWEELFETHLHRHTFATFAPPPGYAMMRNRFFSYVLSPDFDWVENDDEEDEEKQHKEEKRRAELYKKKIQTKQSKEMPIALFERDRTALLNMVDSIQLLNGFLQEIHARKLQYQKG
ncbi:MAG: hypothetical protein K1000chlam2_01820 [Chlamydiae bacterium]|nr:hypothetical protein [Chlamydiota bacterium]